MKRKLFGGDKECPLGCLYCFAKSASYRRQPSFAQTESYKDFDVVYPACDSELLLETGWLRKLKEIVAGLVHPSVIRFSTKCSITQNTAQHLSELNDLLVQQGKGFLLVGVSITTISRLREIEPRTASFGQRLETLRLLSSSSIPCNVTLRPLLPFIPTTEYEEILDSTKIYTQDYLLGDLYVFKDLAFYERFITGKYQVSNRRVDWLDGKPVWDVVESHTLRSRIANAITSAGCNPYYSDLELVSGVRGRQIASHASAL